MEILIIIIGILADRISKNLAINHLSGGKSISLIKDFFTLEYLQNPGAAFGMLKNKVVFLIILTLVVILGMLYYLIKNRKESIIQSVSLSLIICGAIGNLYDRIYYNYVIDFIKVHYKEIWAFPTFNVADICVTVGTILLGIYVLKEVK